MILTQAEEGNCGVRAFNAPVPLGRAVLSMYMVLDRQQQQRSVMHVITCLLAVKPVAATTILVPGEFVKGCLIP